jgi:hypothetical protein
MRLCDKALGILEDPTLEDPPRVNDVKDTLEDPPLLLQILRRKRTTNGFVLTQGTHQVV